MANGKLVGQIPIALDEPEETPNAIWPEGEQHISQCIIWWYSGLSDAIFTICIEIIEWWIQ